VISLFSTSVFSYIPKRQYTIIKFFHDNKKTLFYENFQWLWYWIKIFNQNNNWQYFAFSLSYLSSKINKFSFICQRVFFFRNKIWILRKIQLQSFLFTFFFILSRKPFSRFFFCFDSALPILFSKLRCK